MSCPDERRGDAKAHVLLVFIFVALAAVVGALWAANWLFITHRTSPQREFVLPSAPAYLTDAMALEKAKLALQQEGYDPAAWQPEEDKRTRAPDGTADVYLFRGSLDGRSGTITFHKQDDWEAGRVVQRLVRIELHGDRVVCQVIRPK